MVLIACCFGVRCVACVVGCLLSVVCSVLFDGRGELLVVGWWLLIVVCCLLRGARWLVFGVRCLSGVLVLFPVCC